MATRALDHADANHDFPIPVGSVIEDHVAVDVLGQIVDYGKKLHELDFDDFVELVPDGVADWCETNRVAIGRALAEHRMLLLISSNQVRQNLIEYVRYLSDVVTTRDTIHRIHSREYLRCLVFRMSSVAGGPRDKGPVISAFRRESIAADTLRPAAQVHPRQALTALTRYVPRAW